jgi:hypothetical protein
MPPNNERRRPGQEAASETSRGTTVTGDGTAPCPTCAGVGRIPRHPGELRQRRALAYLAAVAMPWMRGAA